ncbi:hypothetical protein MF672_016790 [Actinomadura sp. ATCC 31491]|uniref:Uncharacterized protein n=1 Tax=Actinomadura luzonensis TaxID=2805427 RepID=A0ABT0FSX6_9ACTN|nr:hypothetical protein [Actinomadura luzonensis]MCK2215434.1 hypothetical protein [Actinomadura luzonensis]
MSVAAGPDVVELIEELAGPAVTEPDYVSSSRLTNRVLLTAWTALTGREPPTGEQAEREFRAALAAPGDLGPAQVERLARLLCPEPGGDLPGWLAAAAERLVLRARPWLPVWVGFTWWALEWCRQSGYRQVVFLGRDGLPFYAAARHMPQAAGLELSLLDVPRRLLGSPQLEAYLAGRLDPARPAAFVDTGCYGTVVTPLARRQAGRAATFFLTSRNPRIFGYLNYLMSWHLLRDGPAAGPADFGVYACDLVESLPKPYTVAAGDGRVRREPADVTSFTLAMRLCVELARHTRQCAADPMAAAAVAATELYRMFQGGSTALLLDACAPKNPPPAPVLAELGVAGLPPQSDIFGLAGG